MKKKWETDPKFRARSRKRRAVWASDEDHQKRIRQSRKRWSAKHPEYQRLAVLRHRYGKDAPQVYDFLIVFQERRCAICKRPGGMGRSRLAIDHRHGVKKIRGLLCRHCNTLLGFCKEDVRILEAAVQYLKNPPGDLV